MSPGPFDTWTPAEETSLFTVDTPHPSSFGVRQSSPAASPSSSFVIRHSSFPLSHALQRIFAFVKEVKPRASNAVAEDLGIVGAEEPAVDLTTVQPEFTAEVRADGVFLDWDFGGHGKVLDSCEFEVDRGSGYVMLTIDTSPGYTDTTPPPAQRTRWKFRAIYRVDDHRVGLMSNVVMVDVGGN